MDHIGSILPKVLAKRGLKKQAQASLIVYRAQQWIEKELREFSKDLSAATFRDGTLHIRCKNSIAAQECQQKTVALKEYLDDVEEIRIVRE